MLEGGTDAVFLGGGADACGELGLDVGCRVCGGDGVAFCDGQQLGYGVEEGGNGPLPPAREGGVVHGDFAGGVEDVPGLDLDGEGEVDRLEEELETAPGETSVSAAVTGFGMREEKGGGGRVGIPS